MSPNPILRRISDGALFAVALPGGMTMFEMLRCIHRGEMIYHLRRIEFEQHGCWPFKRWHFTGEVWEPWNDSEFEVVQ